MIRRKPLTRKTALRAARATLKKSADPADRRGPGRPPSQKWNGWRNREREHVRRRSWRCESPNQCAERGIQVHHTFGRISEPWASSRLCSLNLCMDHHNRVTGQVGLGLDVKLRDQMRMLALSRMAVYLGRRIPEVYELAADMIRTDPPRATFEWFITLAKSAGIGPPDWKET